jgi:nucleotide-binding universal stress UspA family protein
MIERILLPTDGSEHSEKTVRYALDFARLHNAEVVVVYVYSPSGMGWRRGAAMLESVRQSLEEEGHEIVGEVAQRVQKLGLRCAALVIEGSPAEGILKAIDEDVPDLVIMGSRGSGGFAGLSLGSVAETVVRHSAVPVLVVK